MTELLSAGLAAMVCFGNTFARRRSVTIAPAWIFGTHQTRLVFRMVDETVGLGGTTDMGHHFKAPLHPHIRPRTAQRLGTLRHLGQMRRAVAREQRL